MNMYSMNPSRFLPAQALTPLQASVLYCKCGNELNGEGRYIYIYDIGEQLHATLEHREPKPSGADIWVWYYCHSCGFHLDGDDAFALLKAFQEGII